MTRLFNDPADFAVEAARGFAAASRRWVKEVPGGVVRSTRGAEPTVSVVIGGGSGHYPAFAGLVGPGLAHGAVLGNIFASPSAHQAQDVALAAHEGRGVLFSFGNYAGDVLHFGQAEERLRAEGIDCRTVLVTDDISSAPIADISKRRGIAGDLVVFKVASAAAESGSDLDGVYEVAQRANLHTRTLGVAFGGCTLPGAKEPLFTVPEGKMAVGLGIHGEPGIDEVPVPSAAGLARLFVESLLREIPEGIDPKAAKVVPILNGLGSVKYEELYVVYLEVDRLLREAGLEIVSPEVGEFCTSFDMAGASLTLFWLDDELDQLWHAAADSAGYRRGSVTGRRAVTDDDVKIERREHEVGAASKDSRAAAHTAVTALQAVATALDNAAEELGRIDQIAGDGDHGIGMQRGSRAAAQQAQAALDEGAGVGTTLNWAAEAWSDEGGGTSGAIWGQMLAALGDSLGDQSAVTAAQIAAGVRAMLTSIMEFGKAKPGDKTMIDAVVPFADVLSERVSDGEAMLPAWQAGREAAEAGAKATEAMTAKLGRARSHGEKSVGTPDPGAVSFALVVKTVEDVLGKAENDD